MDSGEQWSQTTIDSDTLIERLRAPDDHEAWRQVDVGYGPLLVAIAKNRIMEIRNRCSKEPAPLGIKPDRTDFFAKIPDEDGWSRR